MIACCGPRTLLPDACSRAELAGAARPLRCRQRRRDPHAATRSRHPAPHQSPTDIHLARPCRAQRAEQAAACPAAPAAAGDAPKPAALARPPRRPTLDRPKPTTRPTTHRTADPSSRAADGPRESPMGLQTVVGDGRVVRGWERLATGVGALCAGQPSRRPQRTPAADGGVVRAPEQHAPGFANRIDPATHDPSCDLDAGAHTDEPFSGRGRGPEPGCSRRSCAAGLRPWPVRDPPPSPRPGAPGTGGGADHPRRPA